MAEIVARAPQGVGVVQRIIIANHRLEDTNEQPRNDLNLGAGLEVSEDKDVEVNEEDYNAHSMEEMKERAEPEFYDEGDLPEVTVKLSKPAQRT